MNRFRPQLDTFEDRSVPAVFSFPLPDGSVATGNFSTPVGVDPMQASQTIALLDLAVSLNGTAYLVQPGATADYANGVLVGVTATATNPTGGIALADGTVTVGGYVAPVAYAPNAPPVGPPIGPPISATPATNPPVVPPVSPATPNGAQVTFTLPDGTAGAIFFQVAWNHVDPDVTNQSVTPTAFQLSVAGQTFAAGAASFTTAPTLLFESGEFKGVNFALDTAMAPGFAFSAVSMAGLSVTALVAGTGQPIQTVAATAATTITLDFSAAGTGQAYVFSIGFSSPPPEKGRFGIVKTPIEIRVGAGATATDIASAVVRAFEGDPSFKVTRDGTKVTFTAIEKDNWATLTYTLPANNTTITAASFITSTGVVAPKLDVINGPK